MEEQPSFMLTLHARLMPLVEARQILAAAAELLGQYLNADRVGYAEYDESAGVMVIESDWARAGLPSLSGRHRVAEHNSFIAELTAGHAVTVEDVRTDPRTAQLAPDYERVGVRSTLLVPVLKQQRLLAAVYAHASGPRQWTRAEEGLVSQVAERTWEAVERARVHAALRASEEQLREADRHKDEFLAMLAHELRGPLAPIRQAAQLLKVPTATPEQMRWAQEMIDRQVGVLALLLDDLLDTTRIKRGTLALRKRTVEVEPIIRQAVEMVRPLVQTRGHKLDIELPPAQQYIQADPLRVGQIVGNLLNNAAKYTNPGGHIRLNVATAGEQLVIRVADNGIGIAPDMLPYVFGMFAQAHGSRERSEGGLGIGLALINGLVGLHGGSVDAHSSGLGQGSEFVVRLPLGNGAAHSAGAPLAAKVSPRRKVLVADDNHDAAETLALLLQMEGHDVSIAHDGEHAVLLAEQQRPDVALLDIGMPRLNGYDAARVIRERLHSAIVLVAVTGWGQEEDRRRAREAGFDFHFTKPLDMPGLAPILR
jgi:signal transduction histidine kinase